MANRGCGQCRLEVERPNCECDLCDTENEELRRQVQQLKAVGLLQPLRRDALNHGSKEEGSNYEEEDINHFHRDHSPTSNHSQRNYEFQ
jgi:hypothetical protein